MQYRRDIDGLRAIAVGSVMLYHAEILVGGRNVLPGGFLGVDVFFVISGYLITGLLYDEWSRNGRISIVGFYERRARRILPALFTVMLCAIPVAWLVLLPTQMIEFGRSLLATGLFVANFFWYQVLGEYGAEPALTKPFLHTWSLAVEEQFYLIFPLVFGLLLRGGARRAALVLALLAALGLVLATVVSQRNQGLSFYWLPSRAWELAAGGFLAIAAQAWGGRLRGGRAETVVPLLALAAIALSALLVGNGRLHPGPATVPVVLATMALIWFADPARPAARLLGSGPMVATGLVSYSLYLWHYPVFAFGRLIRPEPGPWDRVAWIALTAALAVASYVLVERPLRRAKRLRWPQISAIGLTVLAGLAVFMSLSRSHDGWLNRFPELQARYGANEIDNARLRDESWRPLRARVAAMGGTGSDGRTPKKQLLWFSDNPATTKVLVVGNSHAKDIYNVLTIEPELFPGIEAARYDLRKLTADSTESLISSPNFKAADVVILSHRYSERSLPRIGGFLAKVKASGKPFVVLGGTQEFRTFTSLTLVDRELQLGSGRIDKAALDAMAWQWQSHDRDHVNAEVERIARDLGLPVLRKRDFICDDERKSCEMVSDEGLKLYYDYGHYTLDGARHFARRIAASGWLKLPETVAAR